MGTSTTSSSTYNGTVLTVNVHIQYDSYYFQSDIALYTPKGDYNISVTANGVTQNQNVSDILTGNRNLTFVFTVPKQASISYTGSGSVSEHWWYRWNNSLAIGTNTYPISLSETISNSETMVSNTDVNTILSNLAYTQDNAGLRTFSGKINWTIQNNSIPFGTQIDVLVQYSTLDNTTTYLQTILQTLNTTSGIFNFSYFDNSPYVELRDTTMRVTVLFALRGTSTIISNGLGGQVVLVVAPPVVTATVPQSASIGFTGIKQTTATIFWNGNGDGGSPITGYHFVLKNNSTGQTLIDQTGTSGFINHNASGLTASTTYKAYVIVINAIGNSVEQSNSFTTLAPVILTCPTGQHLENGVCVNDVVTCGVGYHLENGVCVPDSVNTLVNGLFTLIIEGFPPDDFRYHNNYILSASDLELLDFYSLPFEATIINSVATELLPNITFTQLVSNIELWISQIPVTPSEPNQNSYTMQLTTASYVPTPAGKTVNIQIAVNRIGVGALTATARIQIKQKLSGESIFVGFQDLQIGGANAFPIVFNVTDLGLNDLNTDTGLGGTGQATALISYIVYLWKSSTDPSPLTSFPLAGNLEYEAPPTGGGGGNTVKNSGSILHKFMGVTALFGTLALLSSKGR